MRIHHVRRLSQGFFLALFVFMCAVTRVGGRWTDIRGWPVNWFLQLDPLTGLGTALSTGTLFAGLLWGVATLSLTVLFGRFFCGWVCPFGTIHHVLGWMRFRWQRFSEKQTANAFHEAQSLKFYFLFGFLGMAFGPLFTAQRWTSLLGAFKTLGLLAATAWLATAWTSRQEPAGRKGAHAAEEILTAAAVFLLGAVLARFPAAVGSLQTGLLDPIPFVQRSLNQIVLPALGLFQPEGLAGNRWAHGAWLLGAFFLAAVGLNAVRPRFYCRYVCPAGALMHLLGRRSLYRMVRIPERCTDCKRCETVCDAACRPSTDLLTGECTLCGNCLVVCPEKAVTYTAQPLSAAMAAPPKGPQAAVDISRRRVLALLGTGIVAVPAIRLEGLTGRRFPPSVVRPPGALPEPEFLRRCIKCGQCLRICPTNVLQPALWEAGIEGLWTPVLDFRAGSSGCQYRCVACSRICPTAAIRRLTLDEKLGTGAFADRGPVRIGAAFVDRSRCLPWAFGKPCIVCEENCPVSPKAIQTVETLEKWPGPPLRVTARQGDRWTVDGFRPPPNAPPLESLFLLENLSGPSRHRPIREWGDGWIAVGPEEGHAGEEPPRTGGVGGPVFLAVRLKRPVVDHARCVGCGICEHECPVRGIPAIRVSAENESRHPERSLIVGKG
jgi:ferredoxin